MHKNDHNVPSLDQLSSLPLSLPTEIEKIDVLNADYLRPTKVGQRMPSETLGYPVLQPTDGFNPSMLDQEMGRLTLLMPLFWSSSCMAI